MTAPARHRGFPPIARADARCLLLGSMPSRRSLAEGQYYAHPRNAFWPLMGRLLGFDSGAAYPERVAAVEAAGLAVWDVIAACRRPGSLDADIDDATLEVNDFPSFFRRHRDLRVVCFNGQKAAQVFRRRVLRHLPDDSNMALHTLPSTSPAHAALDFEAKLAVWRETLAPLIRS